MVGLSDTPVVGKVVDRISDATGEAVLRGLLYMYRYKGHVKNLNSKIEEVSIQADRMSRKASKERDNGKIIDDSVLKWQKEVLVVRKSAKELSHKYKNRRSCLPIPTPVSRFKQGRKAVRMAKRVAELVDYGKELMSNEIAYFPWVENVPNTSNTFQFFKSRKDAYEELWKALLNESSSMIIGIYGPAGVGKTRMVEQIEEEAKEKKAFRRIVRADVGSGKLDVIHLQDQIAECFNCHFVSQDNVDHRASQLKNSILNGGTFLIILDDVWSVIPFDIVGIPFGNGPSPGSCKILLTSQEEDVCLQNNCEHLVQITPLATDEAWNLFKNIVGTCHIDSLQDESLGKEVCNQCEGLPLLIHVVGKALESMSHNDWEDTLYQLKNCKVDSILETGSEELDACLKLCTINFP